MNYARAGHVAFKLKTSLYVVGGEGFWWEIERWGINENCYSRKSKMCFASCERYDLRTNQWSIHPQKLPYGIMYGSVFTDKNERFALITGGIRNNRVSKQITVFTEEKGFETLDLKKFALKSKRYAHVSLDLVKCNFKRNVKCE